MDMKFVYWLLQWSFWMLPVAFLGAVCIILARRTGETRRDVRKMQILEDDLSEAKSNEREEI